MPQECGVPEQEGASDSPPLPLEANTENFLDNLVEPQCGHFVPSQLLVRTSSSLSLSHFAQ
jgi:hypothetical protein